MCRAIEIAYESLQSHFMFAIEPPRKNRKELGDAQHSARAIREYGEIIWICGTELEELTKKK